MKNYKLVDSKDNRITDKLKRLNIACNEISCSKTFIFVYGDTMEYDYSSTYESIDKYEEITQKDFLALPEPFIVGDWVKFVNKARDLKKDNMVIFKILEINDICVKSALLCCLLEEETLAKLTPKQIEVLEL